MDSRVSVSKLSGFGLEGYTSRLDLERIIEHDPVSGSRSNQILQFRTGSWSDWISKKLNRIRYVYPNCIDHCKKMLNQRFFYINLIGSNIWTSLPD